MKNLHTFVAEAIMNKDSRQATADLVETMEVNNKGEALAKVAQQVLATDMANKELVADVLCFMANAELKSLGKKSKKKERDEERFNQLAEIVTDFLAETVENELATKGFENAFRSVDIMEGIKEELQAKEILSRTGKAMTDRSLNTDLQDMEEQGLVKKVEKAKFFNEDGKKVTRVGWQLA